MSKALTLNAAEQRELTALEIVIDRGLESFREVGEALARVRDKRLYRAEFPTFEAYCRKRWAFTRQQAYRYIVACEVGRDVSPLGDKLNERQARELVPLPPHQRLAVYDEATDGGNEPTTASQLRHLTAEALASLPPQDQRDALDAAQKRLRLTAATGSAKTSPSVAERWRKAGRLLERARVIFEGLGEESFAREVRAILGAMPAEGRRAA